MLDHLKWYVFTQEEQKWIRELISRGEFHALTSVVNFNDPEKEAVLAEILKAVKPETTVIESFVKENLAKIESAGVTIASPKSEAFVAELLAQEKNGVRFGTDEETLKEWSDKIQELNRAEELVLNTPVEPQIEPTTTIEPEVKEDTVETAQETTEPEAVEPQVSEDTEPIGVPVEDEQTEKELIKKVLDEKGIKYHHKAGLKTLKSLLPTE